MYNLLKFIAKYHFAILFFLIQIFNLALIFQNNKYHQTRFFNSANAISGKIYSSYSALTGYLNLIEQNEQLARENAELRNKLTEINFVEIPVLLNDTVFYYDTLIIDTNNRFAFNAAKVISNSTNKLHNLIYIDKGRKDGVMDGMGVVSSSGVVGIVRQSSQNYATVMPIINRDVNISSKLKDTGYFGNLSWDGVSSEFAQLTEIPNHIFPEIGDTVITSGYSQIFPEGEILGTVAEFRDVPGTGFLFITVKLATNFNNLKYVYIVEDKDLKEIIELTNE